MDKIFLYRYRPWMLGGLVLTAVCAAFALQTSTPAPVAVQPTSARRASTLPAPVDVAAVSPDPVRGTRPTLAAPAVTDPLLAQGRYAEAYAADLRAAEALTPGALYKLDAVLAACQGLPRNEEQYQQWSRQHAGDESPDFDQVRRMMTACADVPQPSFQERSALYFTYVDQGSSEGYYMLGVLYPFGSPSSELWLGKAAATGNAGAADLLGEAALQRGDSEQDLREAYKWYFLSGSLGDHEAKRRMDGIAAQLSQGDMAQAKEEASSLMRSGKP